MTRLSLFNHVEQQQIYQSATSTRTAALPDFTGDEQVKIAYYQLRGTGGVWEVVPTAEYGGIEVIIVSAAGAQLAYQNTFTPSADGTYYEGVLSCGDAAFTSAVNGLTPATSLDAYFALRHLDADADGFHGIVPTKVKLRKSLFTAATPTVPPGETALSLEAGQNLFVKQDGTTGPFMMRSATKKWTISIDDDGQITRTFAGNI